MIIDIYHDLDMRAEDATTSEFYKEILETKNLGNIKSIVLYRFNENMLFTHHVSYLQSNSNHMVIETDNAYIYLTNVRCGYTGHGPYEALKVIQYSFPEWFEENSKSIEFAVFHYKTVIIEDQLGGVMLREGTHIFDSGNTVFDRDYMNLENPNFDVDLGNRTVRIFNPQYTNFLGTIRLIQNMRLKRMDYYIGNDSPLDNKYRFSHNPDNFNVTPEERYYTEGISGVNIALTGELFNVYILINSEDAMQVINTIYLHIFHQSLFQYDGQGRLKERSIIYSKKKFFNPHTNKPSAAIQGSREFKAKEVYHDLYKHKLGISYGMEIEDYDR